MRSCSSIILAAATIVLAGSLRAQTSQDYRPASPAEADVAKLATKSVYPQDVRDSLQRFAQTLIAWPGIVRRRDLLPAGDSVRLVLEHHYFDWKEDHSCQRELYFLSPRGEGSFTVTVPRTEDRAHGFTGSPDAGALVIVYGTPLAIDTAQGPAAISLAARAANAIDARWYSTNYFTYGRAFSDFRFLKMPGCSR